MKFSIRKIDRRWIWLALGLFSLLLSYIFSMFPWLCENLYSRGVFLGVRLCIDYTTGFMPFPMIYVLFGAVVFLVVKTIYKIVKTITQKIKKQIKDTWRRLFGQALLSLAGFFGAVLFTFFWIWGFNYTRVPLEQYLKLELKPLDHDRLVAEAEYILKKCVETRALIPNADTFALNETHFPSDIETEMRQLLVAELDSLGYPTVGRVRGRTLSPKGTLYGFGATGIYMPFVGEGHIDAGLPCTQQPFTMAHELGHGYGFGDEAACNCWGYLACVRSANPAIRYSGYLTYWRYVFRELRKIDRGCYRELRANVSVGMHKDLEEVYAAMDRYPEFFPQVQNAVYDAYLKSQGVKEGVLSYDKVLLFVAAWERKKE